MCQNFSPVLFTHLEFITVIAFFSYMLVWIVTEVVLLIKQKVSVRDIGFDGITIPVHLIGDLAHPF